MDDSARPAPEEAKVEAALTAVGVAEAELRSARKRFDLAIAQAKRETSASYSQIAEAAGLTRSGVQDIVRRTKH